MAQSSPQDIGVNFANSVRDTLMGPINKVADVGEKIRNFVHNPASSVTGSSGSIVDKMNKDLNDKAVQDANKSFVDAANKEKAAAPKPKPVSSPKKPSSPKYHDGIDYVPKTGPAILKKGEAVLNPEDAAEHRKEKKSMTKHKIDVSDELGGKKEKPKKEIHEIHIRKVKSGKGTHIVIHHHTNATEHPAESHIVDGDDELADHLMTHVGTPNPGEEDAEANPSPGPGPGPGPSPIMQPQGGM